MEINYAAIKRHSLLLFICIVGGIAAGFSYLHHVKVTYYLQARVLIQPSSVTPESQSLGRVDPEFLPTQAETIRSPITVEQALETVPVLPEDGQDVATFDPVRHVLDSMSVTPIVRSNVVTIGYRTTNQQNGERLLTSIIDAYRQHVTSLDQVTSETNLEITIAEEESLRLALEKAQKAYELLLVQSPLITKGEDALSIAITELNRYQVRLTELEKQRSMTQAKLRELETAPDQSLFTSSKTGSDRVTSFKVPTPGGDETVQRALSIFDASESLALQESQEQYRLAKLQYEQLNAVYGEKHPALITAGEQLQSFEFNVSQRLADASERLRINLRLTEELEHEIRNSFVETQKEVKSAQNFISREDAHSGDIERLEQLHSAALERLNTMQSRRLAVSEGKSSIEVRILDGPLTLNDMTWPDPKTLIPLAACVGLAVGLALAFLRELVLGSESRAS